MNEQPDKTEFDIDEILLRRAGAKMNPDLSERIIHAAVRTPQAKPADAGFGAVMADLLACFILPRPALSLALCLLLGITGGWLTNMMPAPSYDAGDVLDLVVINEEGWL